MDADGRPALAIRAFVPGATAARVVAPGVLPAPREMARLHPDGLFEAVVPERAEPFPYRLEVADGSAPVFRRCGGLNVHLLPFVEVELVHAAIEVLDLDGARILVQRDDLEQVALVEVVVPLADSWPQTVDHDPALFPTSCGPQPTARRSMLRPISAAYHQHSPPTHAAPQDGCVTLEHARVRP